METQSHARLFVSQLSRFETQIGYGPPLLPFALIALGWLLLVVPQKASDTLVLISVCAIIVGLSLALVRVRYRIIGKTLEISQRFAFFGISKKEIALPTITRIIEKNRSLSVTTSYVSSQTLSVRSTEDIKGLLRAINQSEHLEPTGSLQSDLATQRHGKGVRVWERDAATAARMLLGIDDRKVPRHKPRPSIHYQAPPASTIPVTDDSELAVDPAAKRKINIIVILVFATSFLVSILSDSSAPPTLPTDENGVPATQQSVAISEENRAHLESSFSYTVPDWLTPTYYYQADPEADTIHVAFFMAADPPADVQWIELSLEDIDPALADMIDHPNNYTDEATAQYYRDWITNRTNVTFIDQTKAAFEQLNIGGQEFPLFWMVAKVADQTDYLSGIVLYRRGENLYGITYLTPITATFNEEERLADMRSRIRRLIDGFRT